MNKTAIKKMTKAERYMLYIGLALRPIYFVINLVIGGNHIDEVMLTLNGVSLAENLTDICSERLPVYFDTWLIGGQSPLPTYITALAVKLFGHSLFAVRLPVLIISMISFAVFCFFVKELFGDTKYSTVMIGLGMISPWLIFSSTYLLDCNFMAHMIIFAFYFMSRALNTKKLKYYCASMAFFGLGFYCYMASVLVIPFIIAVLYLILLLKKKLGFKEVFFSFIIIFVVSLPFILFGLVVLGVIPEFRLFGFSFSKMPYYIRADSTAFSGGILKFFENIALNLVSSFVMLGIIDTSLFSLGLNIFQFANFGGGLFFVFGLIIIIKKIIKKDKELNINQLAFLISSIAGIIAFCALNNDPHFGIFYRYATLSYLLLLVEGIGFTELIAAAKKIDYKKLLTIYLCLSFALFNVQFFVLYPQSITKYDILYGDDYYECLDKAADFENDKIFIYENNPEYAVRLSVYSRYYYLEDDVEFVNVQDEFYHRYVLLEKEVPLTEDDFIEIHPISDTVTLTEDFNIIDRNEIDKVKYDDSYTVEEAGHWIMIYK